MRTRARRFRRSQTLQGFCFIEAGLTPVRARVQAIIFSEFTLAELSDHACAPAGVRASGRAHVAQSFFRRFFWLPKGASTQIATFRSVWLRRERPL